MKDAQRKPDIVGRTRSFSILVIRLYREMDKDEVGKIIGRQLVRSGTSIGANIHEAQAGQSKQDFIAKVSIAHKEARETEYWLRILKETNRTELSLHSEVTRECDAILRIISSILITAKSNKSRGSNTL